MATIYSLKGAELLFAPHASPVVAGDRKEIWKRYLGARAYDNSVYLGACNLVGPNKRGKEFSGGALFFGPKGEVLAENFQTEEQLLTADLSAERLNLLRNPNRVSMKDSFFLADRRKELYRELTEREVSPKNINDFGI
jgi:predicted amidohydrolase